MENTQTDVMDTDRQTARGEQEKRRRVGIKIKSTYKAFKFNFPFAISGTWKLKAFNESVETRGAPFCVNIYI